MKDTIVLRSQVDVTEYDPNYPDCVCDYFTDTYGKCTIIHKSTREVANFVENVVVLKFSECGVANRVKQRYNGRILFTSRITTTFLDTKQASDLGLNLDLLADSISTTKKKKKTTSVIKEQEEWMFRHNLLEECGTLIGEPKGPAVTQEPKPSYDFVFYTSLEPPDGLDETMEVPSYSGSYKANPWMPVREEAPPESSPNGERGRKRERTRSSLDERRHHRSTSSSSSVSKSRGHSSQRNYYYQRDEYTLEDSHEDRGYCREDHRGRRRNKSEFEMGDAHSSGAKEVSEEEKSESSESEGQTTAASFSLGGFLAMIQGSGSKGKDEVKKGEVKKDEVKKEEVKKKDEVKKEEVKKDEVKKEEVKKKDEVKKEEVKKEEVNKDKVDKDEVNKEEVKEDEVKKDEVKLMEESLSKVVVEDVKERCDDDRRDHHRRRHYHRRDSSDRRYHHRSRRSSRERREDSGKRRRSRKEKRSRKRSSRSPSRDDSDYDSEVRKETEVEKEEEKIEDMTSKEENSKKTNSPTKEISKSSVEETNDTNSKEDKISDNKMEGVTETNSNTFPPLLLPPAIQPFPLPDPSKLTSAPVPVTTPTTSASSAVPLVVPIYVPCTPEYQQMFLTHYQQSMSSNQSAAATPTFWPLPPEGSRQFSRSRSGTPVMDELPTTSDESKPTTVTSDDAPSITSKDPNIVPTTPISTGTVVSPTKTFPICSTSNTVNTPIVSTLSPASIILNTDSDVLPPAKRKCIELESPTIVDSDGVKPCDIELEDKDNAPVEVMEDEEPLSPYSGVKVGPNINFHYFKSQTMKEFWEQARVMLVSTQLLASASKEDPKVFATSLEKSLKLITRNLLNDFREKTGIY